MTFLLNDIFILNNLYIINNYIFILNNLEWYSSSILNAQRILKICLKLYFNLDKWKGWWNFKRCAYAILIYEN